MVLLFSVSVYSAILGVQVELNVDTGPSIISGFGFGDEKSTLLSMAPGAVAVLGILVCTVIAKHSNRTTAGFSAFILSIIGTVMMFAIPSSNYKARYGGYVLALLCTTIPLP